MDPWISRIWIWILEFFMDNIRGYIRALKFHGYGYGYAKFSWILSMESPKCYYNYIAIAAVVVVVTMIAMVAAILMVVKMIAIVVVM